MAKYVLDMKEYAAAARQAAAEGCVLLKNEDETLPIKDGMTLALFGRSLFHYYKSGTGSGGLVNTRYETGILEALKESGTVSLNQELMAVYESWIAEHPYDKGKGWGLEPWSQKEMPLSDELVKKAADLSDMAIVVIGRTAGEDQDTRAEPGSYYLTVLEEEMLRKVCRSFKKTAVILNVGNIIDMKWVEKYQPSAVLYVWQGGQEGGSAVLDVLTGAVNPCGKLTDTIAENIEDYPSTKNFGGDKRNVYQEDIYVGYRYFETFAKEKVLYPFGFGLSYTTFSVKPMSLKSVDEPARCETAGEKLCDSSRKGIDKDRRPAGRIILDVEVENIGTFAGKEVVQVYGSAPQGHLGKPARELKAFAKTRCLQPGEKEILRMTAEKADFASYDDSGRTGHKSCYVLEAGEYQVYVGTDVRTAQIAGSFMVEHTMVTERLEEALAPTAAFQRLKPVIQRNNFPKDPAGCQEEFQEYYEPAPARTVSPMERRAQRLPKDLEYTGDQGYKLADVYQGKIEMDPFVAQLSDEDLACIVRGEGMCSPKVTPGTASAFGGVTNRLAHFGIPVGCCADGPSGIRMDCGTKAFLLPNGTALGCSFNPELVERLFGMEGLELRKNQIDTLLGPGMNIHRNPLNGRNFEYISEDPYLTGMIAAAQIRGMGTAGVTGTVKHFAGNNQEAHRFDVDCVISERALREIYLKGFEIAVKAGGAYSVMTTYGAVNGIWTAGNYDLVTTILRGEWGFDGMVMTDWFAKINEEGSEASVENTGFMVRAQNDVFMVTPDSASNSLNDNSLEMLRTGKVTRGEFQRCAANICRMLMRSPVMERYLGQTDTDVDIRGLSEDEKEEKIEYIYYDISGDTEIDMSRICTDAGRSEHFAIRVQTPGNYRLAAEMRADASELAQLSVTVFYDGQVKGAFTVTGVDKDWTKRDISLGELFGNHYMKLYFSMSGTELKSLRFIKTGEKEA